MERLPVPIVKSPSDNSIIIVLDLDNTIIDSRTSFLNQNQSETDTLKKTITPFFNPKILNILKRATDLRNRYKFIKAICLLTNNSDPVYVRTVDSVLLNKCKSTGKFKTRGNTDPDSIHMPEGKYFFDAIMMLNHSSRRSHTKSLKDVNVMMGYLGESVPVNPARVFFFDDQPHLMDSEIGVNSIKIIPPFTKDKKDKTNYFPIYNALRKRNSNALNRLSPIRNYGNIFNKRTTQKKLRRKNNGKQTRKRFR